MLEGSLLKHVYGLAWKAFLSFSQAASNLVQRSTVAQCTTTTMHFASGAKGFQDSYSVNINSEEHLLTENSRYL